MSHHDALQAQTQFSSLIFHSPSNLSTSPTHCDSVLVLQHFPISCVFLRNMGFYVILGNTACRCLEHRRPVACSLTTSFPLISTCFQGSDQTLFLPRSFSCFLSLNSFLLLCSQSPSLSLLLYHTQHIWSFISLVALCVPPAPAVDLTVSGGKGQLWFIFYSVLP